MLMKCILAVLLCCFAGWVTEARAAKGPEGVSAEYYPSVPAPAGAVKVTGVDGAPLEGVTLSIQSRPLVLLPEVITQTTATQSDAGGELMPPPEEARGVHFLLEKPGYETLALDASRRLPSTIIMRPGRTISGKVFSPDGQPVSGAIVAPVALTDTGRSNRKKGLFPRAAVRSGADGSFKLDGMPVQSVDVQFAAPGFTPRVVAVHPDSHEHKIALSRGGSIVKGLLVGSKDRAPQPGVPIEASSGGMTVYGLTDDKGTYIIDNLPTGTWTLRPAGGGPLSGTQSRAHVVEIGSKNQTLDVPLVLNQGVMLAGRAIDAETSRGLPGINITLAGYAGQGARAVLTDETGEFAFENLDSLHDVIIRFDPVKFVYLLPGGAYRDYFDLSQAGDTDFDLTTLTIPLHRRLPVRGQVIDASGKPLPDVEVRMQALDVVEESPTKSGRSLLNFMTKSNGQGEFIAGVYPPGRYKIWAQEEALVSQVEQTDVFTTAPEPRLRLRLANAAELEGTVTGANDQPVTAAIVIAWPKNAPEPEADPIPGRETYAYTKSGAGGHFKLTGLRGEPLMLRASHPDYMQPVKLEYDPAQAATAAQTSPGLVLKFPKGGEFSVSVVNEQGEPLSHAEVGLDFREGLEGHRASVMTDRYGNAFAGSIPADQLQKFTVSHPLYASYESDGAVTLPAKNLKVTLQKRAALIANVHGESMVPGVAPEVFLLKAPIGASDEEKAPESGFEQVSQTAVVAGKAIFQSLPAGWYKVAFADSGAYAESDAAKIVSGGGDKTVEITLPKGNHLVGMVVDKETGEPIAGANVTLNPAVDSQLVEERAGQNVTTQQDGNFELYNVGAGRLRVKVIAAGYPDYHKTISFTPGDTLTIELSNVPASLSGSVTAGGEPVEGALLILAQANSAHTPVATAITEASGQYQMDGFTAGSYLLSVEAPIGEGENISRKSLRVDVEDENATQNVEFAGLVTVRGTIRMNGKAPSRPGGDPITLLFRAVADGGESKMVQIGDDGSYTTHLEPGDYTVSLEDTEGRQVTVNEGQTQALDLSF